MAQRQYTETQKAAALATLKSNGGNEALTAAQCDVPRTTLREWAAGRGVSAGVTETCQEKQASLRELWENVVREALGILPDRIRFAKPGELATIAGIGTDKVRLLSDEPTAINEQRTASTHTERVEALVAVLSRITGEDGVRGLVLAGEPETPTPDGPARLDP